MSASPAAQVLGFGSLGQPGSTRSHQAMAIQEQFRVGRSTAYRHLRRGTLPAAERRIGRDGRAYPAGTGGRVTHPVDAALRLTWQALRRADSAAGAAGICDEDLGLLLKVSDLAGRMVAAWKGST